MLTLRKKFKFEASHQLVGHDGKCARLHGHSWVLWVEVVGSGVHEEGPKRGMLIDYGDVKKAVMPLWDRLLDHHHLNETFNTDAPTSEHVAIALWELLQPCFADDPRCRLNAIEIEETCTSACRYEGR